MQIRLAPVVVLALAALASAAPEADGVWTGELERRVKVRRVGRTKDAGATVLRIDADRWNVDDGARGLSGAVTPDGKKQVLALDPLSAEILAADLAARIEARAAEKGDIVTAVVTVTDSRVTAKPRRSRKRGAQLVVKEKHRFTAELTGDVQATRNGTLKAKAVLALDTDGPPARTVSAFERDAPYIDDPDFWSRTDLYVMRPDVVPLDLWPDEVLFPSQHGVKIVVLLPGDYRGRSNGRLGPGTLIIEESGTAEEPLLVTFAPEVGADLTATPHPAERFGESQAQLAAIRIFNQSHQWFRGLTFADGVSAGLLHTASDNVIDRCLWHETGPQPLRIRFNSLRNLVQRCVMRRFDPARWGHGDTVAINLSDEVLTDNHVVSNVILNYTDSYQHTDRDGDAYGLGAGTVVDNNWMGFTEEAYVTTEAGQLMCGENTIDMKMGGTPESPVRITNNVFFGVRAAQAGCAASGSGGYAVTLHRRGTWIEMSDNLFVDCDSGIFLNSVFLNTDPGQGRIDPDWTFTGNTFSGVTSFATAFPTRTGHVLSGLSPATFTGNAIVLCDRLMETEPVPATGDLTITGNDVYGPLVLDPRDTTRLGVDGNRFHPLGDTVETVLRIPWSDRVLRFRAPR